MQTRLHRLENIRNGSRKGGRIRFRPACLMQCRTAPFAWGKRVRYGETGG